jgi:aspartate 1-decarboxylase
MLLTLLKSKLHQLCITDVELEYVGSLAIDPDLMDAVGLLPYEKILVANLANGERLETYAIPGTRGTARVCLNGAAAHKGSVGDRVIVMSFCQLSESETKIHSPRVARFDAHNRIIPSA